MTHFADAGHARLAVALTFRALAGYLVLALVCTFQIRDLWVDAKFSAATFIRLMSKPMRWLMLFGAAPMVFTWTRFAVERSPRQLSMVTLCGLLGAWTGIFIWLLRISRRLFEARMSLRIDTTRANEAEKFKTILETERSRAVANIWLWSIGTGAVLALFWFAWPVISPPLRGWMSHCPAWVVLTPTFVVLMAVRIPGLWPNVIRQVIAGALLLACDARGVPWGWMAAGSYIFLFDLRRLWEVERFCRVQRFWNKFERDRGPVALVAHRILALPPDAHGVERARMSGRANRLKLGNRSITIGFLPSSESFLLYEKRSFGNGSATDAYTELASEVITACEHARGRPGFGWWFQFLVLRPSLESNPVAMEYRDGVPMYLHLDRSSFDALANPEDIETDLHAQGAGLVSGLMRANQSHFALLSANSLKLSDVPQQAIRAAYDEYHAQMFWGDLIHF